MKKRMKSQLGARVARYRQEAGLSQEGLAEKIGVRPETISRLERGHTLPSIETLAEIGQALSIELHELVNLGPSKATSNAAIEALISDLVNRSEAHVRLVHGVAKAVLQFIGDKPARR